MAKCTKEKHVFEYSTNHKYNPGSQMPYGSKGNHTCVCGEKWIEEPKEVVVRELYVKEGTMVDDIENHKHLDMIKEDTLKKFKEEMRAEIIEWLYGITNSDIACNQGCISDRFHNVECPVLEVNKTVNSLIDSTSTLVATSILKEIEGEEKEHTVVCSSTCEDSCNTSHTHFDEYDCDCYASYTNHTLTTLKEIINKKFMDIPYVDLLNKE